MTFSTFRTLALTLLLGVFSVVRAGEPPVLVLPASDVALSVAVPLPGSVRIDKLSSCKLVEIDAAAASIPAQVIPTAESDGTTAEGRGRLVAVIPARKSTAGKRRFRLLAAEPSEQGGLRFEEVDERSLKLLDGRTPVMVYNHAAIVGEHVPPSDSRRERACYIHPLWGLSGEVLTDDFPKDHFHHHGVFWSWPYVGVEGKEYDMWSSDAVTPRFVRWICRGSGPVAAVLAVENGWFIGEKKVMIERVWMRTYKVCGAMRAIDLDFTWTPTDRPVSLRGRGGKSYGGLTMRLAVWPRRDAIVTTPRGAAGHEGEGLASKTDLSNTPLPWADISTEIPGCPQRSGAALFVPPEHPDYPPTWLTRCYGPLCIGWPGVKGRTIEPGEPCSVSYRILVHEKEMTLAQLQHVYDGYAAADEAAWE